MHEIMKFHAWKYEIPCMKVWNSIYENMKFCAFAISMHKNENLEPTVSWEYFFVSEMFMDY